MSAESLQLQYSMDIPLLLSNLLHGAARHHHESGIVSVIDGITHRHSYADCELRARKVAQVLGELGVQVGDRVGTLAWNDHRHYELYFGVSGMGAICHTINPRLFLEQILHIINDAQDRIVVFSPDFLPLVTQIADQCPSVMQWIMLGEPAAGMHIGGKQPLNYEALLARHDGRYAWPVLDERSAAFLCYTSGTTGNPKGVVYSHRATVLHAYACALPDSHNVSACEVVMPVVPMFHANAWEAPFSVTLTGARLVLPGARLDGESLYRLIEAEGVTFAIGVPTVWFSLLRHMQDRGLRFSTLRRLLLGGAATPPAMIEAYAELGVELYQGWGMTETAALTTCAQPLQSQAALPPADRRKAIFSTAGRIVAGADMRIVDDNGQPLPWDGSAGHLQVRAPWATARYFKATESALQDGWLPTGDLAQISSDGFMRLTDRSKDVIKSGGEWISSVEIENIAAGVPGVQAAACIAASHPKWGERPLLIVELKQGSELTEQEVLQHFEGRIAKWSRPDAVLFVDSIPLTATGKLFKLKLRERYGDYLMNRL